MFQQKIYFIKEEEKIIQTILLKSFFPKFFLTNELFSHRKNFQHEVVKVTIVLVTVVIVTVVIVTVIIVTVVIVTLAIVTVLIATVVIEMAVIVTWVIVTREW